MEIYLDNSATTKTAEEAAKKMIEVMENDYGNPSSLHNLGVAAERHLRDSSELLSSLLDVRPQEIYYTSGGTESDNWAVFSSARLGRRKGNKIITSAIEHPAVSECMKRLQEDGFEVVCLGVDKDGVVDTDELSKVLDDKTILVSIMTVNNEVGSIQPLEKIGDMVHTVAPEAVFHTDAVQAFGKMKLRPKAAGIDLLSVSAHKFHGPRGTGFLYVSDKLKLKPFILGGGQQKNMRSGTENTPAIAGMAEAARLAYADLDKDTEKLMELKGYFVNSLSALEDVVINAPSAGAPHIVNASFEGIRSEVLLHALEDKGIFVSAGSACSSHKKTKSATLSAMGLDDKRIESALRFSFSRYTTKEELEETVRCLSELLPALRRFTRR